MLPLIPAQPGTFLIVATRKGKSKPDIWRAIVIGWQYVQGSMAFPVCCCNPEGRNGRRAIVTPEGVTDLTDRLLYADETTWLAASTLPEPGAVSVDHKPATVAESPLASASTAPAADDDDDDTEVTDFGEDHTGDEPLHTGPNVGTSAEGGIGWDTITWSKPNQALTNKSFWSWPDRSVIFIVPGGHPRPATAGIEKVTREDFAALKKIEGISVIDENTLAGGTNTEPEAEDDDDDINSML